MKHTIDARVIDGLREVRHDSRYLKTRGYMQHGDISVYRHCVSVAGLSCRIAAVLPFAVNYNALVRGALLHDYFLYDWHNSDGGKHRLHGFTHPATALRNAEQDFNLSDTEREIIRRHMFPLTPIPPRCREAWVVCLADKLCALRETAHHHRHTAQAHP
jgi:uncharacterized protein